MNKKSLSSHSNENKINHYKVNCKTPDINKKRLDTSEFQNLPPSKNTHKAFLIRRQNEFKQLHQFNHPLQYPIYDQMNDPNLIRSGYHEINNDLFEKRSTSKRISNNSEFQNENYMPLPPFTSPFTDIQNTDHLKNNPNDYSYESRPHFKQVENCILSISDNKNSFLSTGTKIPVMRSNVNCFQNTFDKSNLENSLNFVSDKTSLFMFNILMEKKFNLVEMITEMENELEFDLMRIKNYKKMKKEFDIDMSFQEEQIKNEKLFFESEKLNQKFQKIKHDEDISDTPLIGKRKIKNDNLNQIVENENNLKNEANSLKYFVSKKSKFSIEINLPEIETNIKNVKKVLSNQNYFENSFQIFKKLLLNEKIIQIDLDCLTEHDRILLKTFFIKKKIVGNQEKIIFEEKHFNSSYKLNTERRKEENLKHIIMLGIKFLRYHFRMNHKSFLIHPQNQLIYDNDDKNNKELIDFCFYSYYFGKVADKNNWSLEKFYHPKIASKRSKTVNESQRLKSINSEYLRYIKKSQIFLNDFNNYLNNNFVTFNGKCDGFTNQSYEILINKLISKFNYWDGIMRNKGSQSGFQIVLKDLSKNPKCKLPWSYFELNEAVKYVKHQLEI